MFFSTQIQGSLPGEAQDLSQTQLPSSQHVIPGASINAAMSQPTTLASPQASQSGESGVFAGGGGVEPEASTATFAAEQPLQGEQQQSSGSGASQSEQFLHALWPTVAKHHQIGKLERPSGLFSNVAVRDVPEALKRAGDFSRAGVDAYFACAEYASADSRKATNAFSASAFWADLDCGAEKAAARKGYVTTEEAKLALVDFVKATGLPEPTHCVDSGGGLHVYWTVNSPIEASAWIASARKLKSLFQKMELLADPSRTADIASVLRVPGTMNYKYTPAREVVLLQSEVPLDRDGLLSAIDVAHGLHCGTPTGLQSSIEPTVVRVQASPLPDEFGPLDLAKLASALKFLDPDCDEATWKLKRLAPIANAAREYPDMASDLEDLAKRWSSGDLQGKPAAAWSTPGASNGITGANAFDREWKRFQAASYSGTQVTLGTIYFDALQEGWIASDKFAPGNDVETSDADDQLLAARQTVQALIATLNGGDFSAPLEEANVEALSIIFSHSQAEYQRIRAQLKMANKQVSLGVVDAVVKAGLAQNATAPTHHGYAKALVRALTVGQWPPVGHEGSLYVVDPDTKLWVRKEQGALERAVADTHDGKDNCTRRSDYSAIAMHAISIVGSERFFPDAPVGLACEDGFYRMVDGKSTIEPLTPAHRQRVSLPISPSPQPTPKFDAFLHETFKSAIEGEEAQQVALVQEMAGAVMLGIAQRYQKAFLFFDPFGRAGKGTLEAILRSLVPPEFVTAVSPFNWHREYHLVSLAGVRLNVVGELPDNEAIPAAMFKSVLGGDLVTGRNPTHRPISFKNEAAHIFTSNHMINSRDQSEAFFARWLIIEFPNSRLRSGLPLDPNLANSIIESELPGIAHWALEGAARLLRNGRFSSSMAHERLMLKWRRSNSSLEEFIAEDCELGNSFHMRRSELYTAYKEWCGDAGRKPFSKSRVKELLEHNVGLGISLNTLDGYEIFRGLQLKPKPEGEQKPYQNLKV